MFVIGVGIVIVRSFIIIISIAISSSIILIRPEDSSASHAEVRDEPLQEAPAFTVSRGTPGSSFFVLDASTVDNDERLVC